MGFLPLRCPRSAGLLRWFCFSARIAGMIVVVVAGEEPVKYGHLPVEVPTFSGTSERI